MEYKPHAPRRALSQHQRSSLKKSRGKIHSSGEYSPFFILLTV
jgi:hypothetical protein